MCNNIAYNNNIIVLCIKFKKINLFVLCMLKIGHSIFNLIKCKIVENLSFPNMQVYHANIICILMQICLKIKLK